MFAGDNCVTKPNSIAHALDIIQKNLTMNPDLIQKGSLLEMIHFKPKPQRKRRSVWRDRHRSDDDDDDDSSAAADATSKQHKKKQKSRICCSLIHCFSDRAIWYFLLNRSKFENRRIDRKINQHETAT
jgi:hypothetical protein